MSKIGGRGAKRNEEPQQRRGMLKADYYSVGDKQVKGREEKNDADN